MQEVARRAAVDIGVANQEGCANARVIYVLSGTHEAGLERANQLGAMIYDELVSLPDFISPHRGTPTESYGRISRSPG